MEVTPRKFVLYGAACALVGGSLVFSLLKMESPAEPEALTFPRTPSPGCTEEDITRARLRASRVAIREWESRNPSEPSDAWTRGFISTGVGLDAADQAEAQIRRQCR